MKKALAGLLYSLGIALEETPFRGKTRKVIVRLSRLCWRIADRLGGYDYVTDFV